jgi:MoxR-like ATPase
LQDPDLQLAAETAIVTQRPLLIRGDPGSGKSSFAPFVARNLMWRYYELTITSRTEAKDLQWKFDALARLRDAQIKTDEKDISPSNYVTPGVLWWAFNRENAIEFMSRRKKSCHEDSTVSSDDIEPFGNINCERDPSRAVVLIDEIDKADPDVPNDLLEVLSLHRFRVDELDRIVQRKLPHQDKNKSSPNQFGSLLIVLTTNQERELPAAFIRRCIVHTLGEPPEEKDQIERLKEIAKLHLLDLIKSHPSGEKLMDKVAEKCIQLRQKNKHDSRRGLSTAEFLDTLRVCFKLEIDPDTELWDQIVKNVLLKKES